jgi:two-component system, cell cycle response regulator
MDITTQPNRKTILIVEDDLFLQRILRQKLAAGGFIIEAVMDGNEAIAILEHTHVDLILLDLLLPGMAGQDMLRLLKENLQWKDIPVIIASNLDNPQERKRGKELGAVDYLVKAEHTPDEIVLRVAEELR